MESKISPSEETSVIQTTKDAADTVCVVCFKNFEIYSIGICDHAVCFECSTRMRVLCLQNECPICRQDMPKVFFTKSKEPFTELLSKFDRTNLIERKYGVYFCTIEIQKAYYKLLEHRCSVCSHNVHFRNFDHLKDHMKREHELFYCDLCVDNLKIFSSERRCYTRTDLAHHRRKGDKDDKSHKGHPLCEFCDLRYMDSDELFRHMRRTHLFCHFCDADGLYQYYHSLDDMRQHFRNEHYLCEEGDCQSDPLTSVFRTDIDLKAHITMTHSKYMSKSANKQARMLDVEFTLAPRGRNDNSRGYKKNGKFNRNDDPDGNSNYSMEPGGPGGGRSGSNGGLPLETSSVTFVNPLMSENFPALGNASSTPMLPPRTNVNFTSKLNPTLNRDDFPTLGSPSKNFTQGVTISTNSSSIRSNRTSEVTITRTLKGNSQQRLTKTTENFPPLGQATTSFGTSGSSTVHLSVNSNNQDTKSPNVSIKVNHKPNGIITTHITTTSMPTNTKPPQTLTEAFPALGKTTQSTTTKPQWVQQKSKKNTEPKINKVAPPPQLPPADLSQFPSLASKNRNDTKKKKTSSVVMPVSNNWVNVNSDNNGKNSGNNDNTKSDVRPKSLQFEMVQSGEIWESKSKNKKKKSKTISDGSKNNVNNSGNSENTSANGVIKKRSELKIGTLNNAGQTQVMSTSPEVAKPPPGFSVKPPPGFDNFPALGAGLNDLTFTNSSGQSYSITPNSNYKQPVNFETRNQNLIKKFLFVFDNNNTVLSEFKNYSELFRNGSLPADKYYEHCKIALGDYFEDVFPELLVLLPDIEKQQNLFKVYNDKSKKILIVCENCKQVIFKKELSEHYNYHTLDNHFPSLGGSTQVNNVWKK